jgi:hypothetical protein
MSLTELCQAHEVSLQRCVYSTDSAGGVVRGYPTSVVARCRVVPASAAQQAQYRRDGSRVTHQLFFTSDPQLARQDRVLFGARKLEVSGVKHPDEGAVDHLRYWVVGAYEDTQRQ